MKILRSYNTYFLFLLFAIPAISFAECNSDLSSGNECWTNCTTEDEITICDIIKLDTFWPESDSNNNEFKVKPSSHTFKDKLKTKRLPSGKFAKGRILNQGGLNNINESGNTSLKDLKPNAKADLMAGDMGFIVAGGVAKWETRKAIVAQSDLTGFGPNKNLCRYTDASYRPFNKGEIASGVFHITVKRNGAIVNTSIHNLQAKSGIPKNNGHYIFNLDLASGWNEIEVALDSNHAVDELSETNNIYKVRLYVGFQCGSPHKLDKLKATPLVKSTKLKSKSLPTKTLGGTTAKTTNNLKTSSNGASNGKKCKDPLKEGGWCVKIDEIKTPPGW